MTESEIKIKHPHKNNIFNIDDININMTHSNKIKRNVINMRYSKCKIIHSIPSELIIEKNKLKLLQIVGMGGYSVVIKGEY